MATAPHAQPSRDPANDGTLLGMANEILKKHLQSVDDMLPARIIAYDRVTNRAQVQPLVKVLTTDNRQIGRAQIASIPVMQFGGGGFVLNFNLKPGNLGWIKASDRDISLFLQTFKENAPNTLRLHSFQDSVFIPDVMTGYTINGEDAEHAVLQTMDGAVRVAVWADRVKITAGAYFVTVGPAGITMNAGAGALNITPAGSTFTGPVNMPDGAVINAIPFATHKHTDVEPGGGTSGGPTA